jgi:glycosyltransferase involved in cell wall biosynthesis
MLVAKGFQRPDIPRARQEADTLVEAGYATYVIAWDRYMEFPRVQNVGGAVVHSLSPVNLAKFSKFGLALGGILFQVQLLLEAIKLIGKMKQRPIIHAHDINTLLIGAFLKVLRLCSSLVYDCREFTYGLYYEWFGLFVASLVRVVEERCFRYADAIITVSDPIAGYLRRFNPVIELVYNCPRKQDIPKTSKRAARIRLGLPADDFIVSSVGNFRYGCKFDTLLAAAKLTADRNITYLFVGDGPLASELKKAAQEASTQRLKVVPRVPREVALSYVFASDLTWTVYQSDTEWSSERIALPWKFFESLACGVPVAVESNTLCAKLVNDLHCGIVLKTYDPREVAQAILFLEENRISHQEMCTNARNASTLLKFDWETMSARLIAVYNALEQPSSAEVSFPTVETRSAKSTETVPLEDIEPSADPERIRKEVHE